VIINVKFGNIYTGMVLVLIIAFSLSKRESRMVASFAIIAAVYQGLIIFIGMAPVLILAPVLL